MPSDEGDHLEWINVLFIRFIIIFVNRKGRGVNDVDRNHGNKTKPPVIFLSACSTQHLFLFKIYQSKRLLLNMKSNLSSFLSKDN